MECIIIVSLHRSDGTILLIVRDKSDSADTVDLATTILFEHLVEFLDGAVGIEYLKHLSALLIIPFGLGTFIS